ncbi:hypothetical protein GCM10011413_10420 [Pedobacter psychrotolerans]|uniref:Uncharacterized protein n=1 Tax=Pedobacter psychrotolerans TaxID=1843235 RepID=A0ABQ1SMC1_9SPHI|nr:hypothetical protein GCM10011413_10420 [Pedobacter psychrotolerans]
MKVVNVRVHEKLVINQDYIDPSKWSTLIYNLDTITQSEKKWVKILGQRCEKSAP